MNFRNAFFFILLLIVSCGNHTSIRYVSSVVTDFTLLTNLATTEFYDDIKVYNVNNRLVLYWIDNKKNTFVTYDLKSKKKKIFILDSSLVKLKRSEIHSQILNNDEVGFFPDSYNKFFIYNSDSGSIKAVDLSACFNEKERIVPLAINIFPFTKIGDKINFICTYSDLAINNKAYLSEYFSRPSSIQFSLSDEGRYELFGKFPSDYQLEMYFNSHYYYACVNGSEQLVYSYTASDSVYVYSKEGDFLFQHLAKSKYQEKFLAKNMKKIMDMDYIRKHSYLSSSYGSIIYDKYRKLYYRYFKKATSPLNEEGKFKRAIEIEWSLIVLDSKFNMVKEIDFDPEKYSPNFLIPTEDGVYVSGAYDTDIEQNKLTLHLIQF